MSVRRVCTIDSGAALASDGAGLATANGTTFTVDVVSESSALFRLVDQDPTDRNPFLNRTQLDINAGNLQVAHGIPLVRRPADLGVAPVACPGFRFGSGDRAA